MSTSRWAPAADLRRPAVPRAREVSAVGLLLVGLPAVTSALLGHRSGLPLAVPILLVLLLVVGAALLGGIRVGLPAAVLGALVLNWFFTPPYGTLAVAQPEQLVVLAAYLIVSVTVSSAVGLAVRQSASARQARAEALALSTLAGATLAEQATLPDLLDRIRGVFDLDEVLLLEATSKGWTTLARAGTRSADDTAVELEVPAGAQLRLRVRGQRLSAADRRVLRTYADAAATAMEGRRLAERARLAAQLEAADRTRVALLATVGHDLRTPLAAVKAAVSSLRQRDVAWTAAERDELLATIEEAADRLQQLVANLLDASRLQAGAVAVRLSPVGLPEVIDRLVASLPDAERARVYVDFPAALPDALADAGLLERVLANLVDNALRYSPAGTIITISGGVRGRELFCDVVDHGPGLAEVDAPRLFAPFERLTDRGEGGLGLGLSVARGLTEATGGRLEARRTTGGGLTMRVALATGVEPVHPSVPPGAPGHSHRNRVAG